MVMFGIYPRCSEFSVEACPFFYYMEGKTEYWPYSWRTFL